MHNKVKGSNIKNIRTYIMGLIYRNSFSSVRVPSSMDLAKRFGVTRRTARIVLEGLIGEGFLISKAGIGTFTNPTAGFKLGAVQQKKLISICFGDGSFFYYDSYTGKLFSRLMSRLLDNDFNVYPLVHIPADWEAALSEVENANLDGGIFCNAPADFSPARHLLAQGRPCIAVRAPIDGADLVHYNAQEAFEELLSQLSTPERTLRVTLLLSSQNVVELDEFLRQAIAKQANPIKLEVISGIIPANYDQTLEKIFSRGNSLPDVLVMSWRAPQRAMEIMASRGVSPSRCHLVVENAYSLPPDFVGYAISNTDDQLVEASIELLTQRLANPALPPQVRQVHARLIRHAPSSHNNDFHQ